MDGTQAGVHYSYPRLTKMFPQLNSTFGICEAKPMYGKKSARRAVVFWPV